MASSPPPALQPSLLESAAQDCGPLFSNEGCATEPPGPMPQAPPLLGASLPDVDLIPGELNLGSWQDDQGRDTYGMQLAGSRLEGDTDPTHREPQSVSGRVMSLDAGAYANEDSATLGGTANIMEASRRLGTGLSDQSHTDTNFRTGLSFGAGAGLHAYYGDEDGDGVREIGFGADGGFLSTEWRSELLGQAWNGLGLPAP